MCYKYGIQNFETPVHRLAANEQVERVHNSINELTRIFKISNQFSSRVEIFRAIKELNNSVHSVTGYRPKDIYFGSTNINKEKIINNLKEASKQVPTRPNKNTKHRTFAKGTQILVKITGIRNKNLPRYKKKSSKKI